MARDPSAPALTHDDNVFFVNGKEVRAIGRITVKQAPELSALLARVPELDARVLIKFCQIAIEAWDFEGSPQDRRSYDDLDVIEELIPIANGAAQKMVARMDRANSGPKG